MAMLLYERGLLDLDLPVAAIVFFFSSRRRHTRSERDWSSDVCSSDLDGGFGDLGDGEAGGFNFLGAEAVAGDVDDVIDAAQDAVVAIGRKNGAVGGVVWPVAPVLALRILVVLFVVLRDEALRVTPNRLHDAWPGIANANVAGLARACFHFLS